MAYGMIIDLKKCVGCHACSVQCKAANATPPGVTRSRVERRTIGTYPNVKTEIIPMLCMQCGEPSCVPVCPVGATYKREEDGIVVIDKSMCIGCQQCVKACPYGARYFVANSEGYFGDVLAEWEKKGYVAYPAGTVDKCDFCLSKTSQGEIPSPACVRECLVGARIFGQLDELQSMIKSRSGYQLEPFRRKPSVYYLP